LQSGEIWHAVPDAHTTQAPLGDGSGVLLETDSGTGGNREAHMALVGRDHNIIHDLGTIPAGATSQISFAAASKTAVAFIFNLNNGQEAQDSWRLYLWTTQSHQLRLVASNPTDAKGQPLHGGWITPTLTSQYLYWIQASANVAGWGGSSLMQYDLATGITRRLYAGLTEAFVPYRNTILFTGIVPDPPHYDPSDTSGAPEQMYAVDQTSGQSLPVPAGITAATDVANNIITDGNMIIWNTWEGGLRAWKASWGRSITLVPNIDSTWPEIQKLGLSDATMPALYGHFLVFNPSETYVLDLHTNTFAQIVTTPDNEDVTGPWMSVEAYTTQNSYDRATNVGTYNQYLVNLSQLPDLPSCK
jgi:hypothetical protein